MPKVNEHQRTQAQYQGCGHNTDVAVDDISGLEYAFNNALRSKVMTQLTLGSRTHDKSLYERQLKSRSKTRQENRAGDDVVDVGFTLHGRLSTK